MKVQLIIILATISRFIDYGSTKAIETDESMIRISKSHECAEDLKTLCNNVAHESDISVLTCFQDSEEVMQKISPKCQHFLWDYKHKLTTSNTFDNIIKSQCKAELTTLTQCQTASVGYRIPCLVDHKDEIKDRQCLMFLDEISAIVFSDYHLIHRFMDKCNADITKFKCGRITHLGTKSDNRRGEEDSSDKDFSFSDNVTSQTHTLDCLTDSIQDLDQDCKHQMMRLAELQSNDYHLNRGLYYACRDDRETLCHRVTSGEGRVYKCLMKEKFSPKMSDKCKKELTRKQQVESMDVKASYSLAKACMEDIKENDCLKDVSETNHNIIILSSVLMCLRNAEEVGKKLHPNCRAEIAAKQKELMNDLEISPETLIACRHEVDQNCKNSIDKPGGVLHCLMKLAEPDMHNKDGKLSKQCQTSLIALLEITNPSEDVMSADDAVREACASSYMALCEHVVNTEDAFQCLTNNLNSPKMTSRCRDQLSPLIFFMGLDIKIDNKLNSACHNDAVKLCKGPKTVEETNKRTDVQAQTEYHCMYLYYKKDKIAADLAEARGIPMVPGSFALSAECSNEIFNLIKAQSTKIGLDPTLFLPCFDDISRFCAEEKYRGKEHQCLQTNVKHLEKKCRAAVINYSEMELLDYRLNTMVNEACQSMVSEFCAHEREENIFVCLEKHKMHPQMSETCRAAIEHVQIMSLEEYHIDHRFASFCGPEIDQYCKTILDKDGGKSVTKSKIVSCLSSTVIDKLMQGNKHPLSDECRRQFTFELLQRSESIKLDPTLLEDCQSDIEKFCKKMSSNRVNACLRQNQDQLNDKCHRRLFQREHLEALDADFDGELHQRCSQMIGEHCDGVEGSHIFRCLHRQMNEFGFDRECRSLIMLRLERRMNDIRLNPGLIKDCRDDIKKYCHIGNPNIDKPADGIEYEGKVILCLKLQFTNKTERLQENCRQRILQIMIEANTNMRLDPTLRKGCADDINEFCKKEMSIDYDDPVNGVHNCLKHRLLRSEIRSLECKSEIIRLLREGRADVHVDNELFNACESSIMKLCRSASFGFGRKLSCLLSLVDDSKASVMIESQCLAMIKDRREMWTMVGGSLESQSLIDLYDHVTTSSTRVYLLSMLGLMVVGLILLGICCGRVSKRVLVDHKNK